MGDNREMLLLAGILDDIVDDEFRRFKWHLEKETWNGMEPIKTSKLDRAERHDVVDLMVQKYQFAGAVMVMGIIMEKINRNDLVKKLSDLSLEAAVVEGQ
uniref:Pyrin domain-containing protein n=1 Tax=Poecilia latipinna TaxID=48699 RepID=A0A3B3VUF3_9TELE